MYQYSVGQETKWTSIVAFADEADVGFVFVALEVDTHLHGQLQEDGEKPESGQFRHFLTQVAKVTKVQADNLKKKESRLSRTLTLTNKCTSKKPRDNLTTVKEQRHHEKNQLLKCTDINSRNNNNREKRLESLEKRVIVNG